ncbi:MAG TPA: hypothetical protein VFI70_11200 [Nitrososphaeraceae archaeon]|nr:hypothetical protein [Nitrososphaeraceae archaeon]
MDYTYGLGRIYSQTEIDQAKASPSFEREYNCKYLGQIGNVFHTKDIEIAIEKGDKCPYPTIENISSHTKKVMGIDCGYGSSNFAIVILEDIDGLVRVLFSEEYSKPDFNAMLYKVGELLGEYRNIDKVYIDASAVSFIRAIKLHTGEDEYYDEIISDYRAKKWDWESTMLFVPVSFGIEHKTMLGNAKLFLEKGHLAIHPKFDKLITSLRTATEKGEGILDKDNTAYDDTFDALRLALRFFFYKEKDKAGMRAAMINSFEMDHRFS